MVFKEGYLHVEKGDGNEKGDKTKGEGRKTLRAERPEDLTPGNTIEYVRADGVSRQVEVFENPKGVDARHVYVKVAGTPENLQGFAVPIPDTLLVSSGEAFAVAAAAAREAGMEDEQRADMAAEVLEAQTTLAGERAQKKDKRIGSVWNRWRSKARKGVLIGVAALLTMLAVQPKEYASGSTQEEPIVQVERAPDPEPEVLTDLSIVGEGEGVTQVLQRQLEADPKLADALLYDGSVESMRDIGQALGYIDAAGGQVRVSEPGVRYQLRLDAEDGKPVVVEYDLGGSKTETRGIGSQEGRLESYEYKTN